jgi:hypothetical protein
VLRSYATILVPSLLTAPRYFRGEIEFGVISQARRTPGVSQFLKMWPPALCAVAQCPRKRLAGYSR